MDIALDGVFQNLIVSVTGLPGSMVRPRWQPVPPQEPDFATNWCAVGVTQITPDATPGITHSTSGDTLNRHEILDVLASFYGPSAQSYATMTRDGIGIPQNMEALNALGFGLIDLGILRSVPEYINSQWRRRYDLPMTFRRQVIRIYPVLDIESSEVVVNSDTTPEYTQAITVDN
jgi:hypothetical protein